MDSYNNKSAKDRMFCFVDGCFTTSARNKILGFHKFPGSERKTILKVNKNGLKELVNRRQLWVEALNIDKQATTVIGEMRVCSLHFSKKDFIIVDKRRPFSFLKGTAIPRRNLPLRKNSKLTTSLQFRNFNRIKWRGRLAFQDPDGRLPVSRRRSLGSSKTFKSVSRSMFPTEKIILKKPVEVCEGENLDGGKIQLKTFSLAGNADSPFSNDQDEENVSDEENDIECTTAASDQLQPIMTSEVIIKEEPLTDDEQDMENWVGDDDDDDANESSFDGSKTPEKIIRGEEDVPTEITPTTIRDDLESSIDNEEERMVLEEEIYNEDEMSDETEEKVAWRDRPCKVCRKVDCEGHPTARPSENAFVCLVCSEIFESVKLLDAHSKIHEHQMKGGTLMEREQYYRQQKELTCRVCKKVLATKLTLREHMLIHTGEKPHICMLCGRAFRHKANLVVHINAHTIIRTFECPMCPQTFSMRVDLEDHKRTHTDQQYTCNLCSEAFHSKRALWSHQQIHNKRNQRKKRRGNRKGGLPCRVCGKVLSTKNTLKEHMMIHSGEKPHECLLCGKMIRHKANFIIHVQSHSSNETYSCDQCDMEFTRKLELRHHKQEEHGSKPFSCILCGVAFRKEEGLMHHVESQHGDNPESTAKGEDEGYNNYADAFRPHLLEGLSTTAAT